MSRSRSDAPSITILGLGLIGGSLGIRLRSRGWLVSYVDPHVALEKAISSGAADARLDRLENSESDVIVLAAPLDASLTAIDVVDSGPLITSVCGLMTPVIDAAAKRDLRFAAGHPMAGSEERSIDAARIDLFEERRWFVARGMRDPVLDRLIADAGAVCDEVDPAEHDRAMLLVSHLPQLLSTALAAHVAGEKIDIERFGGSGLRTFLRLAGSPESVWAPLYELAAPQLISHLEAVHQQAAKILGGAASPIFARANDLWNEVGGKR